MKKTVPRIGESRHQSSGNMTKEGETEKMVVTSNGNTRKEAGALQMGWTKNEDPAQAMWSARVIVINKIGNTITVEKEVKKSGDLSLGGEI